MRRYYILQEKMGDKWVDDSFSARDLSSMVTRLERDISECPYHYSEMKHRILERVDAPSILASGVDVIVRRVLRQ